MRINNTLQPLAILLTTTALVACGGAADPAEADGENNTEGTESARYDMTLLEEYRAALPESDQVTAVVPGSEASPNALTMMGDAELAGLALASARDINTPAKAIVVLLRAITKIPPTLYDSQKKEFVWGPWDNEDGYGKALVYIRENPADADFHYSYAFVRMDGADLATASPVIWGGATPDPDDEKVGVGVTLWDFEANRAFEQEYDPDYDPDAIRDHGRFAMVYGAGRGENDDGSFKFNVAVFRNFVSKDNPEAQPADLDYYFGQFRGDDGNDLGFVDWSLDANLCEADSATCFQTAAEGELETLNLRAAFFNRGIGRAEALVSGGDLTNSVGVVECWDQDIDRTYMSVSDDGEMVAEEGECIAPFGETLEDLGIPTLQDVDPDVLAKMDCVATNGIAACELDD